MMDRVFSMVAARIAAWAGQPIAFIIATAVVVIWGVSGPIFHWSDTWQLVINTGTTIVTFLMVFLIQNAQNRDAAAMQVKMDELIRAIEGARNDFIGVEHMTDAELCRIRDALEADCNDDNKASQRGRADALTKLLIRR